MSTEPRGLLIDYDFCTGCHSCEVACKQAHNYPAGVWGIRVHEFVQEKPNGAVEISYLPQPTDLCTLCEQRTQQGDVPSCVKHCQADCLRVGTITELLEVLAAKPKQVLFRLK